MSTSPLAIVTMELQRGICGDLASIGALRNAVIEREVEQRTAELLAWGRASSVPVVHCTFSLPADRSGIDLSLPLLRAAVDHPNYLLTGTSGTELLPSLGPASSDYVVDRHAGVSPFARTSLASMLQSLDVTSIFLAGVSLNVGIIGTAIEAVNHGFHVTVVKDAVVGVPVDYGDAVIDNALRAIARVRTVDQIITTTETGT